MCRIAPARVPLHFGGDVLSGKAPLQQLENRIVLWVRPGRGWPTCG